MNRHIFIFFLSVCFLTVQSNRVEKNGSNAQACSSIIKNCQTRCTEEPDYFVRWIVSINETKAIECSLLASESALPRGVTAKTHVVFNVMCCHNNPKSPSVSYLDSDPSDLMSSPTNPEAPNETKIDALIILGVGTLTSILLICIFLFCGLMIYHKRKRSKVIEEKEVDNVKSLRARSKQYENNEIIEMTAAKADSNRMSFHSSQKQTISVQTSPSKDTDIRGISFVMVDEDNEKATPEKRNDYSIAESEYANQTLLKNRHGSLHSIITASNENLSAEVAKIDIPNDDEIHGSFQVSPKSNAYEEDVYVPYPGFRTSDASTTSDLHSTSNVQVLSIKSKSTDTAEDPYILTPPLKSNRCHQKVEKQDPYQKLVPNGCCSYNDNSDDYNMLSHNSGILSQDAKILFALNNNLKATNSESKCDVTLTNLSTNYTSEVTGFNW